MTGYLFRSRSGDVGGNGQGVDRAGKFVGEDPVDRPAALDARLADELRRPDFYPEMGLAALAMAGMAAVLLALVDHREMDRLKGGLELGFDALLDRAHNAPAIDTTALFFTHT